MTVTPPAESIRCSSWTRMQQVDPVGSAGCYSGFLLVDLPLPWPRDISQVGEIAALSPLLEGRGLRVQATVPSGSERSVSLYATPPASGTFSRFQHWSQAVTSDLHSAVEAVLQESDPQSESKRALICTHGRRDVCCGSLGTSLTKQIDLTDLDIIVNRTSHTGGHRFAPTVIVLPEATVWAYADEQLLRKVLTRSVEFVEVAHCYRGCAGLPHPAVQVIEREILVRQGWDVLDKPRGATIEALDRGWRVMLDLGSDRWVGQIVPGRTIPVPDCMQPIEQSRKFETELLLQDLARM